MLTLFMALLKL